MSVFICIFLQQMIQINTCQPAVGVQSVQNWTSGKQRHPSSDRTVKSIDLLQFISMPANESSDLIQKNSVLMKCPVNIYPVNKHPWVFHRIPKRRIIQFRKRLLCRLNELLSGQNTIRTAAFTCLRHDPALPLSVIVKRFIDRDHFSAVYRKIC